MSVAELLKKKREALAAKNREQGAQFLAEFKQQADVQVLASGVAYQVLVEGAGDYPTASDTLVCHYHGTTVNGEVFDSSLERGQPASFRLAKLIQAYQQVMPLIKVGSKIKLVTPPELAYGAEALNKLIGPYSTLIFEIELLGIEK